MDFNSNRINRSVLILERTLSNEKWISEQFWQQFDTNCYPNLGIDSVAGSSIERLDSQVLLDPAKKFML
jgi:hypothetical protein